MAAPTSHRKLSALSILKGVSAFVMFRFPFLSALTLTMLCSEREQDHRPEGYPLFYIYIHIAVLFTCGTMMSFGSQRSLFAIVTAVALALFTTVTQSQQSSAKTWMVARVASHDVGIIGVFLIMASRAAENLGKRYRLHFLYPYGKNLISIFCIISAVQLYRTPEERRAFLHTLPHCQVAMATLGIALLLGGFLLSSEWQTKRISGLVAVAVVCYLLTIDGNLQYWHFKLHVEYWLQMNMILNSATIVCTLIFMAS
ncbi:transmembrane protein 101-like [Diadema antillarum]|uniref:transmembrane protein 101-like n=1 Tax=Diadema antillarum TaxID=105358 RepID=UPI003A87CD81